MTEADDAAQARAATRFYTIQLVRIVAVLILVAGLAMARTVLPGPYWLGVALALGGTAAFFFAPYALVKSWKKGDGRDR